MSAPSATADRAPRFSRGVQPVRMKSAGRRRTRNAWSMLALVCTFTIVTRSVASEVWVVTDQQHPVTTGANVRRIELDAPSRIIATLGGQLPSDPTRATAIVQERLRRGGSELHQRLAKAYQGIADAWRLGVSRIPAVVVDQRYVVYGEPDVARATSWIEQYRRAQK